MGYDETGMEVRKNRAERERQRKKTDKNIKSLKPLKSLNIKSTGGEWIWRYREG